MAENMAVAWVEVIPQDQACGDLATAYDAVKDERWRGRKPLSGHVADPAGHQTRRRSLPRPAAQQAISPLEPWLSELVSTYVAILCGCDYAARNHGANFAMYLGNQVRADEILAALRDDTWETSLQDQAPDRRPSLYAQIVVGAVADRRGGYRGVAIGGVLRQGHLLFGAACRIVCVLVPHDKRSWHPPWKDRRHLKRADKTYASRIVWWLLINTGAAGKSLGAATTEITLRRSGPL